MPLRGERAMKVLPICVRERFEIHLPIFVGVIDAVLAQPIRTFGKPLFKYVAWNGVGGAKRDEAGRAILLPVRQMLLSELQRGVGIEERETHGLKNCAATP